MKRIFYELKAQPLIAAVTVLGTALAIFLIMVVVMMQQVKTEPFGPEPNRGRMIYIDRLMRVSLDENGWKSSSRLGIRGAREILDSLPGIETYTFYQINPYTESVGIKGTPMTQTKTRATDHLYWKVFNHTFVAGHPYDSVQCVQGDKVAVISRSLANRFWGSPEAAIDADLMVNRIPRRVIGVVEDVTPLATHAYSQVWTPFKTTYGPDAQYTGNGMAGILLESKDDLDDVRAAIDQRIAAINSGLQDQNFKIDIMGSPFTHEEYALGIDLGKSPDLEGSRKRRYIIFLILLIVPAANLAGMTQSRLRRRVGEIGVRRAFGATRSSILIDLLVENFIITLAAGLIGLAFSLLFAYLLGPVVFADNANLVKDSVVSLGALFHWSTFGLVLLFCFVLNLISTGIPALRASRINPVNALNGHQK